MKGVLGGVLVALLALSFTNVYAQIDFELLGSRTYIDSAGNHHIVGEVKNTSNRTWRFIEVAVPFLDADDRVIAVPTGFLFAEYLRPGESGAFHILSANSTEFHNAVAYAVHLNYLFTDLPEDALDIIVNDVTAGSGGSTHITGEIVNLGNITATQVQVSAALYDADNNIIDTTVGFGEDIPAGGKIPFTLISGVRTAGNVEHISLNVQSREYVMVPEFSIPALGLLAGIAATIVFARRYRS